MRGHLQSFSGLEQHCGMPSRLRQHSLVALFFSLVQMFTEGVLWCTRAFAFPWQCSMKNGIKLESLLILQDDRDQTERDARTPDISGHS